MSIFGRRRTKLKPDQIEELLLQFDVADEEIEELKRQNAINIRKLRVVATSGMCPYSENVKDALDYVGELESKSMKLKITKLIRKSIRREERTELDTRPLMIEGEDYDEEDLDDYFDDMTINWTGRNDDDQSLLSRLGDDMGINSTPSLSKIPPRTFWDDIACIFCGMSGSAQEEPPPYDPLGGHRRSETHPRLEGEGTRKLSRTRKPSGALSAEKAAKRPCGHPELIDRLRLAVARGGGHERLDFSTEVNRDIIESTKKESCRIGKLYLGLLKLSDGARFDWKLFSDNGKGTEVYTAYPPGYGEGTQVAIRASTYINASYKRVLDIMLDDTRSSSYDRNVNVYKQLMVKEEERTFIRHYWFHPVWPTQARDTVMVSTWEEQADGSVVISTLGLPDYIEPSEGTVRAYVCSSSCHMRPGYSPHKCPIPKETWKLDDPKGHTQTEEGNREEGEKDEEWCHVTFCTHVDPGGSVPAFVTNLLGPNNSLKCLLSMKDIVEREEKEKAPLKMGLAGVS